MKNFDFDIDSIIGKTIKNIDNDLNEGYIKIIFTDNTAIIFEADTSGDYGEYNTPISCRKGNEYDEI